MFPGREAQTAVPGFPWDPVMLLLLCLGTCPHVPAASAVTTDLPHTPAQLLEPQEGARPCVPSAQAGRPSVAGDRSSRLCSACHLTPETQLARDQHVQLLIYETAFSPQHPWTAQAPVPSGDREKGFTYHSLTPHSFNLVPNNHWFNFCLPHGH